MEKRFSFKDLGLMALGIAVIGLLTAYIFGKVTDSQQIIDLISLLASVTSFALALVAIIYAFHQTGASREQNYAIGQSLKELDGKIKILTSLNSNLTSLKADLTEEIKTVSSNLEEIKVASDQEDVKEIIDKALFKMSNTAFKLNNKNIEDITNKPKYIMSFKFRIKEGFSKDSDVLHKEIDQYMSVLKDELPKHSLLWSYRISNDVVTINLETRFSNIQEIHSEIRRKYNFKYLEPMSFAE